MAKEKEQNFGFPEKHNKHLKASTFKDDANTMSDEELKKVMFECEKNIKEIEKDRDANTKLKQAKELVASLGAGYRDGIAFETAKIKYSLYMLETRGKI
jgi:hypothetical protein